MSNQGTSTPSAGFSAWLALTHRPVTSAAASRPQSTTPVIAPSDGATVVPEVDRKGKGKPKWQRLDLSQPGPSSASVVPPRSGNRNRGSTSKRQAGTSGGVTKLSDVMQKLDKAQTVRAKQQPQGNLAEFLLFQSLPTEIRLTIWGLSLNKDRLLEVQWDRSHRDYCLSARSTILPCTMNVCKEARHEAGRIYQLVNFTSAFPQQNAEVGDEEIKTKFTYFSPDHDIVLFAERTCMSTFVRFLDHQHMRGVSILRVAILMSGKVVNCCGWNHDDPVFGPDGQLCTTGQAIAGGCTVMQALHGIEEALAWNRMVPGVQGLKEVLWVTPTHLLPIVPGTIDESMCFRPARGDGMTTGQARIRASIQSDVSLVESGSILPTCSVNDAVDNWAEDKRPCFKHVSYSPKAADGKIFDSMIVFKEDLPKLSGQYWKFLEKVERLSGCHVKIPFRDFPTQEVREIGLYGTKSGITKAMELIIERLELMSGDQWTAPPGFRPRQGYRTPRNVGLEFYNPLAAATKY